MLILSDLVPLLVAVFLGGIVGLERQMRGHGAGLRTHMMVSLASAIFILASLGVMDESSVEITRVIQGIAAGVGFIGAGTILKLSSEHEVLGLTTASTVWLAAAVGTASGLGEYFLAVIGAALVFRQTLIKGLEVVDEVTSPRVLPHERTRNLVHYPNF